MDAPELAISLDELAILPPASLAHIPTLRAAHAALRSSQCPGVAAAPARDVADAPEQLDVDRLHDVFDACARAGCASVIAHYVDEVCLSDDGRFSSDDGVEAYARDGACASAWARRATRQASERVHASAGRPREARVAAVEDAMRTLEAARRTVEALGGWREDGDEANAEREALRATADEVVTRQLQAEALLWAAREGLSDAVGARYGGPAAWAGAVQRRRSAAANGDARFGGANATTFLDDLLAGVGEHQPAYPFKTVTDAAKCVFVDGSASPAALVAKKCLFLYFLLDSGLPHDGSPMEYARQARIHPRLFQETRAAVLLDDSENEASLDEACALLPRVAHPLLPVKFIASLARRGRATTALMVARARAPSSSDTEAIGLDVSIRLACGLIAEAFIAVRDAFKTFPELRGDSKSGAYLVSLLLDHGVEKLCLDKVLELPFYGEMEKLLLDLLWARRSEVPVETGILYLLNRGRALEASELFSKARSEGRLEDEHAAKLVKRMQESLSRLPVPQKVLVAEAARQRGDDDALLARSLVVRDASEDALATTASALLIDEVKEFEAVLKSEDAAVGILPFLKPPIELARERREPSIDSATAALATTMLASPGKPLTFVRPHDAKADRRSALERGPSSSPAGIKSLMTPSGARTSSYTVPEPTMYASPFGARRRPSLDEPTVAPPPKDHTASLLFGARPTPLPGGDFPSFLSPAPKRAARESTRDERGDPSDSPRRRSSRLAK
jgi:hypothetical protein